MNTPGMVVHQTGTVCTAFDGPVLAAARVGGGCLAGGGGEGDVGVEGLPGEKEAERERERESQFTFSCSPVMREQKAAHPFSQAVTRWQLWARPC